MIAVKTLIMTGRNPYFIGINSAIIKVFYIGNKYKSRNPYFIGINSAMTH